MYFDKNNRVKLLLGLGRGKKLYDKRQDMAERDMKREMDRALKAKNMRFQILIRVNLKLARFLLEFDR